MLDEFLAKCTYESGSYDDEAAYKKLNEAVEKTQIGFARTDRIFYMALPPSVFAAASHGLKSQVYTTTGTNRIIVEKPFGKDSASSKVLGDLLAKNWHEDEVDCY